MLDYASILQAGQNLVPDLREEMFRDQELKMRQSAMQMQQEQRNAALQAVQQEAARKQQLQVALADAAESGDPRQIHRLMLEYPEFAAQLKPGVDAMSADQRTRTLTQGGALYARLRSNDTAGAANILKARIAADREAGQDVSEDEEMLAAIQSGDPAKLGTALTATAVALAAIDPDKFGETFGKLNPDEKLSPAMREYQDRVSQFGKDAADKWLATQDEKFIPVQAGGSVFRASDLSTGATAPGGAAPSAGGGGQAAPSGGIAATGAAIEQAARGVVPGVGVTSRKRSPERNRQVGGAANSFHLTDQARDFTPPSGMSMAQLAGKLRTAMPGFDVINEGDHVHVEPSSRAQGPVQVRSKQQYDRLPSGTEYTAPDGSRRRKP